MDRGAWQAAVHGVAKSQTGLSEFHVHFSISSIHQDSPRKNSGVNSHALFQGIFPTQGSNLGLPHRRQILYRLSHQDTL